MDFVNRIRSRRLKRRLDAAAPHPFQSIDPLAAPAATNPLGLGGTQAPILALAADAMRGKCRLYRCGKPADDPIHA